MNYVLIAMVLSAAGISALHFSLGAGGQELHDVERLEKPDIRLALVPRRDILEGYQVVQVVNNEGRTFQPVKVLCNTSKWAVFSDRVESQEFRLGRYAHAQVRIPLYSVTGFAQCEVLA